MTSGDRWEANGSQAHLHQQRAASERSETAGCSLYGLPNGLESQGHQEPHVGFVLRNGQAWAFPLLGQASNQFLPVAGNT